MLEKLQAASVCTAVKDSFKDYDEYKAQMEQYRRGKTEVIGEKKLLPVLICTPKILRWMAPARTWTSAVRDRRQRDDTANIHFVLSVPTSQRTNCVSTTKSNRLRLFRTTTAMNAENRKTAQSIRCEQNADTQLTLEYWCFSKLARLNTDDGCLLSHCNLLCSLLDSLNNNPLTVSNCVRV